MSGNAEQGVRAALEGIIAAYGGGVSQIDKYFSYFAEDLTIWRGEAGRRNKAEYYKIWKGICESGGGNNSAVVSDLVVQMSPSGDAAVTSFQMTVVRRFPGGIVPVGEPLEITYNMTDVWFDRGGTWQVVHMYFTRSSPPPPG